MATPTCPTTYDPIVADCLNASAVPEPQRRDGLGASTLYRRVGSLSALGLQSTHQDISHCHGDEPDRGRSRSKDFRRLSVPLPPERKSDAADNCQNERGAQRPNERFPRELAAVSARLCLRMKA